MNELILSTVLYLLIGFVNLAKTMPAIHAWIILNLINNTYYAKETKK